MSCNSECGRNLKVGTRVQHCPVCHRDFSTEKAGDAHRTGPPEKRRCLSAKELTERGYYPNDRAVWRRVGQNPFSS